MAKYIFGIDLGTTYSCIAYVDESGRATVVKNQEGDNTTPSVVNFASPSQVVVGQVAKDTAVIDPQNTVSLVKTLMGKTNFAINYNGEDKSPEEVSAYILRKLTEDASKQLMDTEVKDVVITCPAYFGTAERTATKNAGEIAGLNVIEVINEPTAAALYYGCSKEQSEKTILVYDLGGGTFDVTIMSICQGKIEVICSDGIHELGGKDWDDAIMRYLASEFSSETGFDGDFDEYAQQDLRLKAENVKKQLSSKDEAPVMLDVEGKRARIKISRTTFDEITQGLLDQSIEKTDAAIAVAESKGYKVDEILLVGGSTRMPQVTKALVAKYGIEPKILEPDEAVAKGAAIYALGAYEQKAKELYLEPATVSTDKIPGLEGTTNISEVVTVATTKSYAIRAQVDGKLKCCNMIIKNTKMENGSISVTNPFRTLEDNQRSVVLPVYESDYDSTYYDPDEDFLLGSAELELPGNLPAGSPIEVTLTLDNEGILKLTGRELTANREVHATMNATGGTTMSKEAVKAAAETVKDVTLG